MAHSFFGNNYFLPTYQYSIGSKPHQPTYSDYDKIYIRIKHDYHKMSMKQAKKGARLAQVFWVKIEQIVNQFC